METDWLQQIYASFEKYEMVCNIVSIILLGVVVAGIVGYCFAIKKTGEAGWKGIIPFYNIYIQCKKTSNNTLFVLWIILTLLIGGIIAFLNFGSGLLGIEALTSDSPQDVLTDAFNKIVPILIILLIAVIAHLVVTSIMFAYFCKSFGISGGMTVLYVITGLPCCCLFPQWLFLSIFMMVVGFGNSNYIGNAYANRDNPQFGN